MKESTIMKIHYGTALASVGLVAVHILMRLTTGFSDSLSYENVLANYQSIPYVVMLELILILLAVHGFNGLRGILLDYRSGYKYEKAVNWGCFISTISLIAYGTMTIILANFIELY